MGDVAQTEQFIIKKSALKSPKSALPKLQELLTPPLAANGLIVAVLLMEKHPLLAFAIIGGCAVGLLIFASLHYFADKAFGLFTGHHPGEQNTATINQLLFGFLAGGKFIAVGALMYVLIAVLHLSLIAFVVGFLITQVCVSISVINRLAKSKVTD